MSCINQKKKDEEPEHKSTSNEEFLRSIRGSWERHYSESAFLKDVPRLVKRIQVHTRSGACHGPVAEDAPKIEAIVQLLELISKELSSEEEVVRELRQKLERCEFCIRRVKFMLLTVKLLQRAVGGGIVGGAQRGPHL